MEWYHGKPDIILCTSNVLDIEVRWCKDLFNLNERIHGHCAIEDKGISQDATFKSTYNCLQGCTGLISIQYPNTVKTLGLIGFRNTIPAGWSINGYTFDDLANLEIVHVWSIFYR